MPVRYHCRFLVAAGIVGLWYSVAIAQWSGDPTINTPVSTGLGDRFPGGIINDEAGGVFLVWEDHRSGSAAIYAQHVNKDGVSEWTADGLLVSSQGSNPAIVSDSLGGVIIAWEKSGSNSNQVYVQRLGSDGIAQWTTNGIPIRDDSSGLGGLRLVADSHGGIVAAWEDFRSPSGPPIIGLPDIYAQRVDQTGISLWSTNGVKVATSDFFELRAESDNSGGAIVVWEKLLSADSTSYSSIYCQRIDSTGALKWGSPTDGLAICTVGQGSESPALVGDGAGGAFVAWQDYRNGLADIYGQAIRFDGVVEWQANGVPICQAPGAQKDIAMTPDGKGGAILAWTDSRVPSSDVFAQRLNSGGASLWATDGIAVSAAVNIQQTPQIASVGNNGVIIAWDDYRNFTVSGDDIYAQRVDSSGQVHWTLDGVPVSTAGGDQTVYSGMPLQLEVPQTGGAAIMTWLDHRAGNYEVYAQKVLPHGALPISGIFYSQTFDGTVAPSLPAGWSATPGENTWNDVSGTSSFGYPGASRGNNLVATNDSLLGTLSVTTNAISTRGANVTVLWGARRTASFINPITFDWSADSVVWKTVAYTEVQNNATWALVNQGVRIALGPQADNRDHLYFRWTFTQIDNVGRPAFFGNYRIDDLTIEATSPTASYYYGGSGDLNSMASWWTNVDGTGFHPTDFTSDDQTFQIRNGASMSTTAPWTVSGVGSKVVLGTDSIPAVHLLVVAGNPLAGVVQVDTSFTGSNLLTLEDDVVPTLDFCDAGSTVEFNQASGTIGVPSQIYGNLTLQNGAIKTFAGALTTVNGSFNHTGGAMIVDDTLAIGPGGLSNSAPVTINGAFQFNQGGFVNGDPFVYGPNGALIFNNRSGGYIVNNDPYWPGANGPFNVIQQNGGGLQMNVPRVVNGKFSCAWGGVLNGNNLTVADTVLINVGGFFISSPTYIGTSTLVYNTNSYNVSNEWTGTGSVGVGVPYSVLVRGNTNLLMPASDRGVPGDISIFSGAITMNDTSGNLVVGGSWFNGGRFIAKSRTLTFTSTSGGKTIGGVLTGTSAFHNLVFDGLGGAWSMHDPLEVNDTLAFLAGSIITDSSAIILDSNAVLSEASAANVVGTLSTTRRVNDLSTQLFLGVDITPHGATPGSTKVVRTTGVASLGNGHSSVLRTFTIIPETDSALDADLVLHYRDDELNGQHPATLKLFKSIDSGVTWTNRGGIVDTALHIVTVNGLNNFSRWTISNILNSLGETPPPTVISISPPIRSIGDSAFVLTVRGNNFIKDSSIVLLNGSYRTTTYVNESELDAAILAGDLQNSGADTVSVYTSGGGGVSNVQLLTVIAATISGTVFNDLNGNGGRDSGEIPLANWMVLLKDSLSTIRDSALTDSAGFYSFSVVSPGTYTMLEVLQNGWIETSPPGRGVYALNVSLGSTHLGFDFGNIRGYQYNDSIGGLWSEPAMWQGGHVPGPNDAVTIPENISVVVDALPSDSVLALRLLRNSKLTFEDTVGPLKVASVVHIDSGAAISFDNSHSGIICNSDFVNRGTFISGLSTISFRGDRNKSLVDLDPASSSDRNTFYNLNIAGDRTSAIGNIRIANRLNALYPFATIDSVLVDSPDAAALIGQGLIPSGTIRRAIGTVSNDPYRFESESTYVRFTGVNNPSSLAMTSYPNSVPPANVTQWEVIRPAMLDTTTNTIAADSITRFSRWAIGVIRPNLGLPKPLKPENPNVLPASSFIFVDRFYDIASESAGSFLAHISLRYEQSEVPPGVGEDTLLLLRSETLTGVPDNEHPTSEIPSAFVLEQNYPNPFNPVTTIRYLLPVESRVRLSVYNLLGQLVATLVDELETAGAKTVAWNPSEGLGREISSGVYLYKLEAISVADPSRSFTSTKKIILLR